MIHPIELIDLGFTLKYNNTIDSGWEGHRLFLKISDRAVKIKMGACSCPLVFQSNYTTKDLINLLRGLNTNIVIEDGVYIP